MVTTATLEFTVEAVPTFTLNQEYPTYAQSIDSSEEIYDEIISDRTWAGALKTRTLIPTDNIKKNFNVIHPALTLEQRTWLIDFYKEYRDSVFTFTWKADNTAYYVKFVAPPKITIIGGHWWKAVVQLAEVN